VGEELHEKKKEKIIEGIVEPYRNLPACSSAQTAKKTANHEKTIMGQAKSTWGWLPADELKKDV